MRPYMRPDEIRAIEALLKPDWVVLEYGAGGSTTYFPKLVLRWMSRENNKAWFNKVKPECGPNVQLEYQPDLEKFILPPDRPVQLAFVDGPADPKHQGWRSKILTNLHDHHNVGFVLLHDAFRKEYEQAVNLFARRVVLAPAGKGAQGLLLLS